MGGHLHRLRAESGPVSEGDVMTRIAALRAGAGAGAAGMGPAEGGEPIPELVSIDDIRQAAANLAGVAMRTPLVPFGTAGRGGPRGSRHITPATLTGWRYGWTRGAGC